MDLKTNIKGIGFLVLALFIFSFQNIIVKSIGGDYSLLEIVAFRSLISLPLTLLFYRYEGKRGLPTTKQFKLEILRGICLFLSYTTHFMGLAALPMAVFESIRFSSPLMITLLSVAMLGEKVSIERWLALLIGFVGVYFVVRPGSASFNIGSVFALMSVFFYTLNVILTRKLKSTDSPATMAYYSSFVYLIAAFVLVPLPLIVGEVPNAHVSIAFLLRPWVMPSFLDWAIISSLGLIWGAGMYLNSRAYSITQASVAAPFEYFSLPINIIWGFLIWGEIPTLITLAGAGLTLLCGLYILYRERK